MVVLKVLCEIISMYVLQLHHLAIVTVFYSLRFLVSLSNVFIQYNEYYLT